MSYDSFEPFYRGTPPWEIASAQPAVVALDEDGQFTTPVLDVGCGTGENALHLASRGHTVLGVDGAPTPIERARAKAAQRNLPAEFRIADAFDLTALGRTFETVLDSAFLHVPGNTPARRRAYTHQLAAVLAHGGWAHMLQISEEVTEHPSMTSASIIDAFGEEWNNSTVRKTRYAINCEEIPAWLVSVQRR